jgi:uncharacterized protein
MRLVLDTNVVISGLLWHGIPSRLIECAIDGDVDLFSSERLIGELTRSLSKPSVSARVVVQKLTGTEIVDDYLGLCSLVVPALLKPIAPDPDDDWVIATGLAAKADFIVTGDKPLLSVGKVEGIRIVGVAEALEMLEAR